MKTNQLIALAMIVFFVACHPKTNATPGWPHKSNGFAVYGTSYLFSIDNGLLKFNMPALNVNYEYLRHIDRFHHGYSVGLSLINLDPDYATSPGVYETYTIMLGRRSHHFETRAGFAVYPLLISEGMGILPAISLGYRYQQPEGRWYLRTAISTAGLGIGGGFLLRD